MDKALERLTLAADYDPERQDASHRNYDALAELDGDVADLEQAFNDACIPAAYAVAVGWSAPGCDGLLGSELVRATNFVLQRSAKKSE